MIENVVGPENNGNAWGTYSFITKLASCIPPLVFSGVACHLGAPANPALYGQLIAGFYTVGSVVSSALFCRAGKYYSNHMKMVKEDEER